MLFLLHHVPLRLTFVSQEGKTSEVAEALNFGISPKLSWNANDTEIYINQIVFCI
jgi:hypothetical protein